MRDVIICWWQGYVSTVPLGLEENVGDRLLWLHAGRANASSYSTCGFHCEIGFEVDPPRCASPYHYLPMSWSGHILSYADPQYRPVFAEAPCDPLERLQRPCGPRPPRHKTMDKWHQKEFSGQERRKCWHSIRGFFASEGGSRHMGLYNRSKIWGLTRART